MSCRHSWRRVRLGQAASDDAYRRLIGRFVEFYAESLHNAHWGEIVNLRRGNPFEISMAFQGLTKEEAEAIWRPFFDWLMDRRRISPSPRRRHRRFPARHLWILFSASHLPEAILSDDRPGARPRTSSGPAISPRQATCCTAFSRPGCQHRCSSRRAAGLADALFDASRDHPIELHFQKGLAGGSAEAIAAAATPRPTPTCSTPSCLRSSPAKARRLSRTSRP